MSFLSTFAAAAAADRGVYAAAIFASGKVAHFAAARAPFPPRKNPEGATRKKEEKKHSKHSKEGRAPKKKRKTGPMLLKLFNGFAFE